MPGYAAYPFCIYYSHDKSLRLVPLPPQVYNDELELRKVKNPAPAHTVSDGVVI